MLVMQAMKILIVNEVVSMILHYVTSARKQKSASTILATTSFMDTELLALETAAKKTLAERGSALIFLKSYLVQ